MRRDPICPVCATRHPTHPEPIVGFIPASQGTAWWHPTSTETRGGITTITDAISGAVIATTATTA